MTDLHIVSPSMRVEKDPEFGRVILIFESEKTDVEFLIPAYAALNVGLEILAGAKDVIDSFYKRVSEETVQ